MIFVTFLLAGLAGVDRWLKVLALNGLTAEWGGTKFILVKNDALVFSWPAPNWVASLLMMMVIGLVVFLVLRRWRRRNVHERIAAAWVILGALSNLYDRLTYGFVIDWGYLGPWWPIFNLADIMIAVGIAWWLFSQRQVDSSEPAR